MKIDPSKSFRVENQQPSPQKNPEKNPLEKELDTLKLQLEEEAKKNVQLQSQLQNLKEENEKSNVENANYKQTIAKMEEKAAATQQYVEGIVKLVSVKSSQLKEVEEKLKTTSTVSFSHVDTNNLKTELLLAKEKITELEDLKKGLDVYEKVIKVVSTQSNTGNVVEKLLKDKSMSNMDKIRQVSKILIEGFSVKQNELKITLNNFQPESIVIFVRDTHGNWEIFNRDQHGYYMSIEAVEELKKKPGYKDLLIVVAQILYVEGEVTAQKGNAYGFLPGSKYHVVHVYPFQ